MDKIQLLKKLRDKLSVVASIEGKGNIIRTAQLADGLGADMLELRIDSMGGSKNSEQDIVDLVRKIRKNSVLPIIGTIRSPQEQELYPTLFQFPNERRLKIFQEILDYIDFVDIEVSSNSINKTVIQQAHNKDKLAILSYHNFRTTPPLNELTEYANKAFSMKADVIKIATMANDRKDVRELLMFCQSWDKCPIVAISLGAIGAVSRFIGFLFKSCLTYGYVHQPLAPGQVSIRELVDSCRYYYSDYNQDFIEIHKVLEAI